MIRNKNEVIDIDSIKEIDIDEMSLGNLVDLGLDLWDLREEIEKKLTEIKDILRTQKTPTVMGERGICRLTSQPKTVKIRKGVNFESIPFHLRNFFRIKIVPIKGISQMLENLEGEENDIVFGLADIIDLEQNPQRITFSKK